MATNQSHNYVPALLIALILLASIICGLIFVICTTVLCKFCYERRRKSGELKNRSENSRNSRLETDDKKLCRKLLGQEEMSKPSETIIFKAKNIELDSRLGDKYSRFVNATVQTEESSFQFLVNNYEDTRQENIRATIKKSKRLSSPNPNEFKPMHSKSRVKVQIQNYITPISDSNNLQIAQAIIRRYSDNSPYKDEEALEAESYSRGRSASHSPQTYRLSPTPSISVLPLPNDDSNLTCGLVTPSAARRGSHHLRPFDTHWGHTKLSHSMELVSSKPSVQSDERKVHSFDTALGRRRVLSVQTGLFQTRSLTTSTSDDVATSSLDETNHMIFTTIQSRNSKFQDNFNSQFGFKDMVLLPDEVKTYTFQNQIPGHSKQRSYQNIVEHASTDNYKARKSYVGEFNAHPEYQSRKVHRKASSNSKKSSPKRVIHVRQSNSNSSSRNQSQISSKDSIMINIIDSDSEKVMQLPSSPGNHPKLSVSSMIDPSLSPQTAAARRRQFSRERQSLIQASDINELHHRMDATHDNRTMKQILDRDYSIDERSSVLFNEFMRDDPRLDKDAMEAQMRERIRIQRKSTNTPTKAGERSRSRHENRRAASFAGKNDFQSNSSIKDRSDEVALLNCPPMTALQQRRQSIGKMKVKSCDHRVQLPVIILPDDSP